MSRLMIVVLALASAACGGGMASTAPSPVAPATTTTTSSSNTSGGSIPASLVGQFAARITADEAAAASARSGANLNGNAGTWQLGITGAARYSLFSVDEGKEFEGGPVTVSGNRITLRVDSFSRGGQCASNFPLGSSQTYTFTVTDTDLQMTNVDSGCLDDILVFTTHALARVR